MLSPNGTFYNLEGPSNPVGTTDQWIFGIIEPSGILRAIYLNQRPVRVRRLGPGRFDIVPLTPEEFEYNGYNRDLTSRSHRAAEFVADVRNRRHGGGSG